jgi:PHD/YefM family antitoxin component YafN of YafNO toxin-antitoxin module
MFQLDDIHSLTHFQRNTKEHLERLKTTGRPEILTVNGKAELVVQDAASYQKLLEALDRVEALEGIRRGLASMKRGEGRPLENILEDLRREHESSAE